MTDIPGAGGLFDNDRKERSGQPDMTGYTIAHRDIKVGEKLNLAAWMRTSKAGKQYLSLKLSDIKGGESRGDGGGSASEKRSVPVADDLDDSIPF